MLSFNGSRAAVVVVVVVTIDPTIKALAPRSQQRMQTQWRRRTQPERQAKKKSINGGQEWSKERAREREKRTTRG